MRNQSERDTRHSERASHEREHHSHGRGRRGRLFEAGRMKLLVLYLIQQSPKHGYEIIKEISDLVGGDYLSLIHI